MRPRVAQTLHTACAMTTHFFSRILPGVQFLATIAQSHAAFARRVSIDVKRDSCCQESAMEPHIRVSCVQPRPCIVACSRAGACVDRFSKCRALQQVGYCEKYVNIKSSAPAMLVPNKHVANYWCRCTCGTCCPLRECYQTYCISGDNQGLLPPQPLLLGMQTACQLVATACISLIRPP